MKMTHTKDRGSPRIKGLGELNKGYTGQIRQSWKITRNEINTRVLFLLLGELREKINLLGILPDIVVYNRLLSEKMKA